MSSKTRIFKEIKRDRDRGSIITQRWREREERR